MKKKILTAAALLISLVGLTACQKQSSGESITAVGSSALQPLVEAAGEQYSNDHLGKFINVQGGGSGTGLSQIQAGAVDIGNSDVHAEEQNGVDAKKLVDHRVAVVGITPVVNKKVGVTNLSFAQLKAIFTGQVTNWQQLGGADLPIVLVNRAAGSGTRVTFEKWVLQGSQAKQAQEQDSTGMVRQIVAATPGAISYLAFSYVDKSIAAVKINHVAPTDENVLTNKWKIWSYEHMYTKGKPTGLTKDFIAYVLSPKIQEKVLPRLGYISISQMKVERDVSGHVTRRS
ncbi:phosphate ABC transporter substrate-binding protein PstS family protein [Loigolactobacillus backii]|uniref:Phosphate-binding protein n=1 Tax=Loigolactobacillus backii TaxID=375175 RepID=A0A192H3D9_9LACO|nr:phosphate ABC transporter substrate-binding protein PstS family protein [Loigolactobacillus backii]ANK59987.1 phosphate ABC transporter substrate-binding protein [Loigolactobacillus backii]ANK63324.1 phosphate ABC transporter substrate-binding protein [Loigolactobacillus backii]ANK64921.1 phosphate ABC transporter substrate-binding protein [Loigolactobacillus backii]ANK66632.1 phosphate ABC transporter substrate-binding protein [Loigolactobacillus backii]ANK69671.1 phosphate ABC transporter